MNTCPICHAPMLNGKCAQFPICNFADMKLKNTSSDTFVLFDLETTGLEPKTDRIIEIGACKIKNGEIIDEFSTLVNPGTDEFGSPIFITPKISELTGITNEMVEDMPAEAEAVSAFLDWCSETNCFAGHNIIRFDIPFVKEAAKRAGEVFKPQYALDTLNIARNLQLKERGLIYNYKQTTIASAAGITYNAHRAVDDCKACFKVYQFLEKEAEKLSQDIVPVLIRSSR